MDTFLTLTSDEQIERVFEKCLSKYLKPIPSAEIEPKATYVHSIKGLADFLGCSVPTAQNLKNSGKIRFTQFGRKCIFNTAEVLEWKKRSK